MRTAFLATLIILMITPATANELGYDEAITVFTNPTVRLDDGRFYPVHRGDGRDYCRDSGYRGARELRIGEYIGDGLARHKGGRWQYTADGPMIARLRCY